MAVGNTIGKLTAEPMLPKTTPAGSANPPEKKSWWSKWGDVVHTGLDILGAVPVVGIVADGANAAIYAAEGDYVNAAISGASAAANLIPGGGAAMKAGKAAVAVGKQVAKTAAKEGAEALAKKAAKEAAEKAAKEAAEKAAKEGAEAAGKKAAKKAGSDAGGGVKGKGKKTKPCKTKLGVGKPVNPVLGVKFLNGDEDRDFDFPAPLPLPWQRSYFSDQAGNGWLGQGWSLPLSVRLLRRHDGLVLIDEQGRDVELPELEPGEIEHDRYEDVLLAREPNGRYRISAPDGGLSQIFAPLDLDAADPDGSRASYLPLIAIEDRNGNRVRVQYDDAGYPRLVEDSAGRHFGLTFETLPADGPIPVVRLTRVVQLHGDPADDGRWPAERIETLVQYRYDGAGDLVAVHDGGGAPQREFRYRAHLLIEHRQPGGLAAAYEYDRYDRLGRVIRHTTSLGQVWQFAYGRDETVVTDPLERVTRYRYNDDRELVCLTDAAGGQTRFEHDGYGRVVAVVDPAGRATRYAYDDAGNLVAIVEGSLRTEMQYDERWRLPTVVTDANGASTTYVYDAAGNLVQETDALGRCTRYNHDARGLIVRVTDAAGGRHRYDYDAAGQLVASTDCSGHVTRYAYDGRGRLANVVDALGRETRYRHDLRGNLREIVHPDGATERFEYDALGRLVATTDAAGHGERWELGADGLPHARIDALGHRLSYQYDLARRLVVLTDGNGAHYRFAYDAVDNLIAEQGFDGRVTGYAYDAAGLVTQRRELGLRPGPAVTIPDDDTPETIVTRFVRDALGRVVEKVTGRDARAQRVRYAYDAVGRLVEAVNSGGRVGLVYDDVGHVVEETSLVQGRSYSVRHVYDALDNCVATELPDGRLVEQRYHGRELHEIRFDGEALSTIERDALRRETVRTQGRITSFYDYDAAGRLSRARARRGHDEPVAREYHYDRIGNLLNVADRHGGSRNFVYDPLSRLVAAGAERFRFDPAHNLTSDGSRVPGNRVRAFEDRRYRYDTHGDLVEKTVAAHTRMTFDYDAEHQLVAAHVERNGLRQETRYGYDALGRRAWKQDAFGLTTFCWGGNRLLCENRGARSLTFVYEQDSFAPLAQIETVGSGDAAETRVRYYHNDQSGLPHELSDADGTVRWRAQYRAWGNAAHVEVFVADEAPEAVHQPLRYQGQYFDSETGLHYNRYRYYDPDIGRFVTQDPVNLLGGENGYQYAPNPGAWIDPNGLKRKKCSGNPCDGVNPSAWARQWQGHGIYKGRDTWTNTVLKKGTVIYGGAPGQSGFYFDAKTLAAAGGSKAKLWQSLQVLPHPKFGYRPQVQAYVVKKDTCVATGIAQAQDPSKGFGAGGGTQVFLADFKTKVAPVGPRINLGP
ncbi:MAG TPA: RHS repeat-associated core domain-containing protein [Tahibacter sp.]|uniref:RHS repeat-associated core domain-containing protein n=1 Tax=Tahibacter sp. TaxID=2056211 RepID=UPI002D10E2AD|nr:RHS repeat-associated core domain-containing protein [Tahibacter sp.]HSX60850.1 RHS repeat-associated core domain-containing protein [Tahibacter sp.]